MNLKQPTLFDLVQSTSEQVRIADEGFANSGQGLNKLNERLGIQKVDELEVLGRNALLQLAGRLNFFGVAKVLQLRKLKEVWKRIGQAT
jgi:hypothetical protein